MVGKKGSSFIMNDFYEFFIKAGLKYVIIIFLLLAQWRDQLLGSTQIPKLISKWSKCTDKQNSATWWFTRMCQAGVNNIMLKVPVCRVIVIPNHTTGTSCYKYDLLFIDHSWK